MGTNLTPDPQAAPPEQAPPPEQQAPEGPPRDESGRFAAPQPPTVPEPPALPQPPGAPRVDPDRAVEFYERISDPRTRAEEFVSIGREYGFVPDGLTPDQVQEALLLYQDYQEQLNGGQAPAPVAQPPLPGPPMPGQDGTWQGAQIPGQPSPPPFDPDRFAEQIEKRVMGAWEQREQQQQLAAQQAERLNNLQSAIGSIAEKHSLNEAQTHGLLQQVALGIDTAVQQGRQVDFSEEALTTYGQQVYDLFASMGAAAQQADTQEAIAHHRQIAPQTTVPTGPAQAGAPGGPRGIQGVAARIKAAQAARAAGG